MACAPRFGGESGLLSGSIGAGFASNSAPVYWLSLEHDITMSAR
jgi:hypothetical protein